MGLFGGGNKTTQQNDYDYSQTTNVENKNDNRDMSTTSNAYDNSVSVVNQSSTTSDFGSIKAAFDFATKAVDGVKGNSSDVMSFANNTSENSFSLGLSAIKEALGFGQTSSSDAFDFGAKALDFQSDTAKDAFELVDDSQDAAYDFSSSQAKNAYEYSSDAITRAMDAMGGVLDMNKAVNSEALQTVSDLTTNIATGGAVTTGQNMNKAMMMVAAVAVVAVIAVSIGKRK